ncbi:MAG: hypothetical protein PHQ93_02005 [Sulfurimonas sp.]|uniref:hypothetical protein n=1 Tax=Sulfurimonas sp. TaxID=2022749 RepID=UPI002623437D|nr:hypothetical protein [Sulfurimonas sp.]MDD5399943.1 hypothetical protein [Sulfurimonas sp.]
MDTKRDFDNNRNNLMYYNQMLRESEIKKNSKRRHDIASTSFSSQEVEFSNYLLAPNGYEGIFYTIYFLTIPYAVGTVFLFFFIADASYGNFKLLDMSSFLIVWLMGYEIVATLLLIAIFLSFLRHDDKSKKKHRHHNHR